ncbi:hypothetical protein X732_32880 [Mesorhizobium sp. L2C066B000]|nr:hypothetical protein X732_32880 [Mesorhizobium sp. L2C066B000]
MSKEMEQHVIREFQAPFLDKEERRSESLLLRNASWGDKQKRAIVRQRGWSPANLQRFKGIPFPRLLLARRRSGKLIIDGTKWSCCSGISP